MGEELLERATTQTRTQNRMYKTRSAHHEQHINNGDDDNVECNNTHITLSRMSFAEEAKLVRFFG